MHRSSTYSPPEFGRHALAQADADEGRANSSRLSSDEKRELAELRKKACRLEVENEILKRAAAYFARETSSQSNLPAGP
jgi:transposase-like protein